MTGSLLDVPADLPQRVLADLRAALPERALLTAPAEMQPYCVDFRGRREGHPLAVILPSSTQEVAAAMRIAAAHGLPVYPQGGNTGLCYGAVPSGGRRPGVVVALGRMRASRQIDAISGILTVDAGIPLAEVHALAGELGLQFALYLGSEGTAQIGGLISTNAGGTGVLRYGPMRSLVAGIEVVLPDGEVLSDLSALAKNNTGYDLKQLFIGAEGTLGIITAAALKLSPKLQARADAWVSVPDPAAALRLLARLKGRCGEAIEAFEMLNGDEVQCVLDQTPGIRMPYAEPPAWSILIGLGAADPTLRLTETLEDLLAGALEAEEVLDAVIAQSITQAESFWHFRHSVTEAHKRAGVGIVLDVAVRTSEVPSFLDETAAVAARDYPMAQLLITAHLGDGNVHVILMFSHAWWAAANDKPALELAVEQVMHDVATRHAGTISAEHGIGRKLTSELVRVGDPLRLALQRKIKMALDPEGRMNPGALFEA